MSTAFNTLAEANARQILVKALFNGLTEIDGKNIIDETITEAVNASGGLTMGNTISSKLTMNLTLPKTPLLLEGGYVQPSVGLFGTDTYCPLGKFYITEAISNDDFQVKFTITAYDGFSKTEKPYVPTIAMPNTAGNILRDIASQCGIELESSGPTSAMIEDGAVIFDINPEVNEEGVLIFTSAPAVDGDGVLIFSGEVAYPTELIDLYDYTCRQYIGYIAGLMGKNARFNRNGKLEFVWYTDTGYTVPQNTQYMGGLKRLTSSDFTVNSITSGSSENVITAGTGIGITFDNPLMTQEILSNIFASVGVFSYTPANLKWRGNPAIEAGDIIMAEDKTGVLRTVYVMEQTLKIGGGMHSEIKCYGDSEAAVSFSTSPQAKKLQQVYDKLQSVIKEATELLNGNNGGVFEITDENADGINDGWIIHSPDQSQFIKANLNGIGITTDGGATYKQAMTVNGINASVITTGQMNAQRISVGDSSLGDVFTVDTDENGHPIVTIGASNSDIKQKQTNDAITFVNGNNSSVARFSITGAEWADMQQMKYCGFLWTKSAVTGNVRFTKVGGST
jgi:hypothetical protein